MSAVRLMRIELGGAFADLLNEKGKGSGDNEMGYVERSIGFRTRDLDDRDLRLVISFPVHSLSFTCMFVTYNFSSITTSFFLLFFIDHIGYRYCWRHHSLEEIS